MTLQTIPRICSLEGCEKKHYGKEFCRLHYDRWAKHGDPTTVGVLRGIDAADPERFFSRVATANVNGCCLWLGRPTSGGYGILFFDGQYRRAHIVAFFLATGRWPSLFVLHSCDVRACVSPDHLREGSHQENMADMKARGRAPRGERGGRAKLTAADVIEMRTLYASGKYTLQALATRFGIVVSYAGRIILYKNWRHIA